MSFISLSTLADHVLVQECFELVRRSNGLTATLLLYLAEIDRRRLYVPGGYESMRSCCVGQFGMSEDEASKRIHAARAARDLPAIYDAISQGRLHLSGVVLLAPHLTPLNVERLLSAAVGKTCAQIRELLAAEAPKPDVPTSITPASAESHATQHVISHFASAGEAVAESAAPRTRIEPLSPGRSELRMTMDEEFSADLTAVMELEGYMDSTSDVAKVLGRALKAYRKLIERRKCGAASGAREPRVSKNARTIPAHVRAEVWRRDGGQCAFVSARGHRCECRRALEFDHIVPRARGGTSTVENLRLLCRAHNQYAAEQVYGAGFMAEKREQARARAEAEAPLDEDVVKGLRTLGYSAHDAHTGAEACARMSGQPLEARFKMALRALAPLVVRHPRGVGRRDDGGPRAHR